MPTTKYAELIAIVVQLSYAAIPLTLTAAAAAASSEIRPGGSDEITISETEIGSNDRHNGTQSTSTSTTR